MSWEDIGNNNNNSESTKVEYLSIPVGVTKIRIVGKQPVTRWTHWIQAANGGKGISVACLGKGCPVCKEIKSAKDASQTPKYNSSKSHAIDTIDRADSKVKIMDKGNSIFQQIVDIMAQMPDINGYDLSITRKGEGKNASYTVIPVYPPFPLTQAELDLPLHDIKEITKPLTTEQVLKLMQGANISEILKESAEGEAAVTNDSNNPHTQYNPTPNISESPAYTTNIDFTADVAQF